MHLNKIIAFIAILLCFNSCSLFDNDSFNPAYLILENPALSTRSNEGDPVHDIKDVWVFIDGKLLGIFPLPAKVPVITTGKEMNILISAGVKENGDINSSFEYPFMTRIEKNVVLNEGKEEKIPLNFSYKTDIKFDIVEGFETSFQQFTQDIDGNTETRFSFTTEDKVSGQKSGIVTLNNSNKDFEVTTVNYFNNSQNAKGSVFLEFDYKCDENLLIGTDVIENQTQFTSYKVILSKTTEWKRAYINFSDEISNPNTDFYRVMFGAGYERIDNVDSKIYLDNIKLIHF